MPFDALVLSAVRQELEDSLPGCRIDKIQQPMRDTTVLSMRGPGFSGKLLLAASANRPRIHLTTQSFDNPAQPPMFCMLLRKHLSGARLAAISQPPGERLLDLTFDCIDEMGSPSKKHLILEIMGRNSNLILTNEDGHIIDCLRRVDFEMSEQRQVLPGLFYRLPPSQEKRDPFLSAEEDIAVLLSAVTTQKTLDRWLLETFCGFSPLVCRELSYRIYADTEVDLSLLDETSRVLLAKRLAEEFAMLRDGRKTPVLLYKEGALWDFSCLPIRQYGDYVKQVEEESFGTLLDKFYSDRDRDDAVRQKTQTLRKLLGNLQSRTSRKLENQKKELAATFDRETLRRLGDIVTANLYAISRGQTVLQAVDFYDPEMKTIEIRLNPAISPQQNAAKYYKDYQKAKTAEKILTEQIAKGETELEYLSSVLDALSRCETERDIEEIRVELMEGGYLRKEPKKKQMKLAPTKPMQFISCDGYTIWVGRNNRQNDLLTMKYAAKNDIWLHVQKIHGSHVIIETNNTTPPDETVTQAMMLAAYYSHARGGQNIPVDYTPVRNVKKPNGAKPGMVIYDRYATAMITPDETELTRMRVK